jgi:hypothetical protein
LWISLLSALSVLEVVKFIFACQRNARILSFAIKPNPETLFRRFSTHQFSKLRARAELSPENMTEFRIARSDATDNGRRKYYTFTDRRSSTSIFSYPRFGRFIEKAQREYSVKVRNPLGVQHLTEATNRKLNLISAMLSRFAENLRALASRYC